MKIEPLSEHRWLQQLVGDWSYENESVMEPGQPPFKFTGIDRVRTLGEAWILCEGEGNMPDGDIGRTIMTLGYDPAKKKFVGTFIGSMMTYLWIYEGTLVGNVLTLDTEGPSFSGDGKMAKYQDIIDLKSPDHRTLTSRTLGEDGKWQEFMTAHYRRQNKAPEA